MQKLCVVSIRIGCGSVMAGLLLVENQIETMLTDLGEKIQKTRPPNMRVNRRE